MLALFAERVARPRRAADVPNVADPTLAVVAQDHSGGDAYERTLALLVAELSDAGLLDLTVWRRGGAILCSLDRLVAGRVERDACDASPTGRLEGAAIASGLTHVVDHLVAAPIVFDGRILGALSARFASPAAAPASRRPIEAAADRLAALLEVMRLTRRDATASQDREIVVAALQSIAGGHDLHAICDALRRHLARVVPFDCVVVARTEAEAGVLNALYLFENGIPREISAAMALSPASPGATAVRSGRTLIFRHTSDWARFGASQVDRDAAPGEPPASAIFVPLKSAEATVGVLSIQAERAGAFGDREQALLEPIAEGLGLAIARSNLQHQSEDARIERSVMVDVARALAQDPRLPRVFEEIWRQTQRLVDSQDFYAALASRDGRTLEMTCHLSGNRRLPLTAIDRPSPRMLEVFQTGRPIVCNDRREMAEHGVAPELRPDLNSMAIVPLRTGNTIVGVMNCGSPRERAYPPSRADLLVAMAEQAAIAVNNARLYEEAAESSNRDVLTGLLNHRAIMASLQRFLAEREEGVAAVLLDVEAFRLFNSTFGHHVGDEVLRLISGCILRALGERYQAARYGGDEFLVVLPDGGVEAAGAFLERLRAELLATPLESPSGVPIPIAFSAGVAAAPLDGTTREALVACADERLQTERSGTHAAISHASGRSHPALTDIQEGLLVAILRKDLYTRAHIHFVGEMALDFAAALRLDAELARALFLGSLLHDVGKICVPDAIISKPSGLTHAERKVMQRHPIHGFEIVRGVEGMDQASLAVLHHHERIDGHGYPFGLAGSAIPAVARMVTIVDAFSAMVLDRPYHKAISDDAAKAELRRCAGTQFDAEYVSVFCRLFDA